MSSLNSLPTRGFRGVGLAFIWGVVSLSERPLWGQAAGSEPAAIAGPELLERALDVTSLGFNITGWGASSSVINLAPGFGELRLDFGQIVDLNATWQTFSAQRTLSASEANDGKGTIPAVNLTVGEVNDWTSAAQTVAVACGEFHTLLLRRDGLVTARGWNEAGQVNVPEGLTNVVRIAAGADHSLAIRANGTVVAWGWNDDGQCQVPEELKSVLSVSGGGRHSLALRRDGSVVAWGGNDSGQTSVPPNLPPVRAIAAGGRHSLALLRDGSVVGWGEDLFRQATPPTRERKTIAIAAGGFFGVGLRADGTVFGWGDDRHGQTSIPEAATNVVAIAAGNYHALALRRDGVVIGWGESIYGSLAIPESLSGVAAIAAGGYHNQVIQYRGPALQIRRATATKQGLTVALNLVADREYTIESSPDLREWTEVYRGITRPGGMEWDPVGGPRERVFFRLGRVSATAADE